MNIRAASLVFVIAFAALPARAQDIESRVTALENAVAKLNGQITSADLVGTYTFTAFHTRMETPPIGTPGPWFGLPGAAILTGVQLGTVTLAADGTALINFRNTNNTLLSNTITQGVPTWQLLPDSNDGGGNPTWTYADGRVAVSSGPTFSVAAGGRLLIFAVSSNDSSGTSDLLFLTRLQ